ncbi:SIMPL domain-containing protein [Sphingobacterium thalpophilum]|uniref:SIMPL domain-containing protein n=2 Tax=Sphingobacterium thalpophilum TaxID=259 RepID=A0ABV4HBL5_9SPHI|nr:MULTISPECIES: SIMPL domain-containing protein [Sphingobacterium]MCW8310989.1 SIMPL domain-containing protein [Sphingobacterium sp. InxBP1]
MKKLLLGLAFLGLISQTNAQQMVNKEFVSTVGRAEEEVTPDIIYIDVTLKEFYENGNTKKKVAIDKLEKDLFDSATKAGVKKEDFTIQNIWSYNTPDKKKKDTDILLSRQYRIKVTNLNNLSQLLDGVDKAGIQSTYISEYDYSKKKELEKTLKTKAVLDAKANAQILAEAAGQKIGKAIVLSETPQQIIFGVQPTMRNAMYKSAMAESADQAAGNGLDLDIRPMKVTSEISASFELL